MDRVVKAKREVRRKRPTYIGWSDTLILDRQISDISTNTLFNGRIALPLRYRDSDDESSYEVYSFLLKKVVYFEIYFLDSFVSVF